MCEMCGLPSADDADTPHHLADPENPSGGSRMFGSIFYEVHPLPPLEEPVTEKDRPVDMPPHVWRMQRILDLCKRLESLNPTCDLFMKHRAELETHWLLLRHGNLDSPDALGFLGWFRTLPRFHILKKLPSLNRLVQEDIETRSDQIENDPTTRLRSEMFDLSEDGTFVAKKHLAELASQLSETIRPNTHDVLWLEWFSNSRTHRLALSYVEQSLKAAMLERYGTPPTPRASVEEW